MSTDHEAILNFVAQKLQITPDLTAIKPMENQGYEMCDVFQKGIFIIDPAVYSPCEETLIKLKNCIIKVGKDCGSYYISNGKAPLRCGVLKHMFICHRSRVQKPKNNVSSQ